MKLKLFYFLLLCSFVFLSSCCALRKINRTEETRTIKVDTVLTLNLDLKAKIKTFPSNDTARVENNTARATSYIDSMGRIVIKIEGKTFDVPFSMDQTIQTRTKEIIKEPKPKKINRMVWFSFGLLLGVFITLKLSKIT